MTELWKMGAEEVAGRIRAREVSSREVVASHLARAASCGARVTIAAAAPAWRGSLERRCFLALDE